MHTWSPLQSIYTCNKTNYLWVTPEVAASYNTPIFRSLHDLHQRFNTRKNLKSIAL